MTRHDIILAAVLRAIEQLNSGLAGQNKIGQGLNAPLFGNGALDSVDFVNFALMVEENVSHDLQIPVDLMGESLLMENSNPFSSISALVTFIDQTFVPSTVDEA